MNIARGVLFSGTALLQPSSIHGMGARINLTGQVFGEWVVIEERGRATGGHYYWFCRCSCGVTREVLGVNLRNGVSRSCGHVANVWGGLWGQYELEYNVWSQMKDRCDNPANPSYKNYGARGIGYVDRWKDFRNFVEDMGAQPFPGAQLDRRNNDWHYSKENCQWVTAKQNMRNSTAVMRVTYNGKTRPLTEWCELLGLSASLMRSRLRAGWSVERAFTTPNKTSRK